MIWGSAGAVAGAFLFFTALYRASRAKGIAAVLWSVAAVAAVFIVFASVVHLAVPGFFGENK